MTMAWSEWEDFAAGLYASTSDADLQAECRALLADEDCFREAAVEMLREWPEAARHNLVRLVSGKNAWLGQATCCYSLGASAQTVRDAWGTLTNDEQRAANRVAVEVRERWEREAQDGQAVLGL